MGKGEGKGDGDKKHQGSPHLSQIIKASEVFYLTAFLNKSSTSISY